MFFSRQVFLSWFFHYVISYEWFIYKRSLLMWVSYRFVHNCKVSIHQQWWDSSNYQSLVYIFWPGFMYEMLQIFCSIMLLYYAFEVVIGFHMYLNIFYKHVNAFFFPYKCYASQLQTKRIYVKQYICLSVCSSR